MTVVINPFHSNSEAETEAFGESFAKNLARGSVVGLIGDLGTGKTCFVRGVCRGLQTNEAVRSPTFSLMNVYSSGILPVYHFDAYRLEKSEEALEIGLEEYIEGNGVCIIEWAEKISALLPAQTIWLRFRHLGEKRREIEIIIKNY